MPELDRRITVLVEAPGHREDSGHYIPGPTTEVPVWARLLQASGTFAATVNVIVQDGYRQWLVRYRKSIEQHNVNLLTVRDEDDRVWQVTRVSEATVRPRHAYMVLDATYSYGS